MKTIRTIAKINTFVFFPIVMLCFFNDMAKKKVMYSLGLLEAYVLCAIMTIVLFVGVNRVTNSIAEVIAKEIKRIENKYNLS